ncbi:hypothetical protein [Boudabousia marimammalium]|uniref:Uncharacterized protein n=1 Tax=Boudabousia marimammalium TaxID=156892 RepID=A0A1Q5PJG4_9ACTO|nr:hypothetical protein [Boudabousia marimammalium]OKL46009.1 hypothetical protein BM477_07480 [Boudabousia marimammalium]
MYFLISIIANLAGAVFVGVQFARICDTLQRNDRQERDLSFLFSSALLAFTIPFYSPVSHNLGATVALFIALSAASTLVTSRLLK